MQDAAVELFRERGYDGTTTAEIAARAGVTERTFFRHFIDKREVLFNEAQLHARLEGAITQAPGELGPLEIVHWAFRSLEPMFEENRGISAPSREIIARTPALQERQLAKTASTAASMAAALLRRGIAPEVAGLAAAAGMAVAAHALQLWLKDETLTLAVRLDQAFAGLRELSTHARM
jgi:AcrR family transcriptional regulator